MSENAEAGRRRLDASARSNHDRHLDECQSCREFLGHYVKLYRTSPAVLATAENDLDAGTLIPGDRLGRHEVLARVGQGEMAPSMPPMFQSSTGASR